MTLHEKTLTEFLRWHLYEPIDWEKRLWKWKGRHADYCEASVHNEGRGVGFHQCSNKRKHVLFGHGWCGLHAKRLREAAYSQNFVVPEDEAMAAEERRPHG